MAWAHRRGVQHRLNDAGSPTQNAYVESFNGKFRAECLNEQWFETLGQARQEITRWRRDYNEVRPHSAIGGIPPAQFAAAHRQLVGDAQHQQAAMLSSFSRRRFNTQLALDAALHLLQERDAWVDRMAVIPRLATLVGPRDADRSPYWFSTEKIIWATQLERFNRSTAPEFHLHRTKC
jgi:putative transposase